MHRQEFFDTNLELLNFVAREFLLSLLFQELVVADFRLLLRHEIAVATTGGSLCTFNLNEDIDD
jgi:hypothetical protein